MPKRPSPHPTEAELEVLSILWERGPSTVREVHDVVLQRRETSLTTTLKTLQVMTHKGLVLQGEERPQKFRAAAPEEKTQSGMLKDLVQRAFGGSANKLVMRLVDGGVSPQELDEIARLIRDTRKKRGGK
jgi:predicted transcriptional regulator